MLIFSQDKKKITDCVTVCVKKNFGAGKEAKYIISGTSGLLNDGGEFALASYPDEKTAMDELEKMFMAFSAGAKTYML